VSREWSYWKIVVVVLAGVVGAGLGVDGAHAPRLNPSISGIATRSSTAPAGGAPQTPAKVVRVPTRPSSPTRARAIPPRARAIPPSATTPQQSTGPLLSETRYGAYAYQVYPTTASVETDRALTGFRLTFRRVDSATVQVTADLPDGTTQSATFASSDRLYFIETRMGDDGFEGETNLGDDGFVITDADGHIVRH